MMKRIHLQYLSVIILLTQCSDEKEPKPVVRFFANFTASHTTIKAGESITFTDLSDGDPNEWHWIFDGGEPNNSTERNPVVKYTSPGSYHVSLTVSNGDSEAVELKQNFITVESEEVLGTFLAAEEATFGLSIRSDFMQSMIMLEDNSFICVGWTDNESTQEQGTNILVTKFDKGLKLIWNKLIGGGRAELVRSVIATNDGGFLLGASTESSDGDIPGNKGSADIAIFKLTGNGDIEWVKTYGGSDYDGINHHSLIELENGYAFIGFSKSEDAGIVGKAGLHDIWLVEIDNNGTVSKSLSLGSAENDYPYSFVRSSSGYVVLSKIGAATNDFDKAGIWVFEVAHDGTIGWKTFLNVLNAGTLIQTVDGGYMTLSTKQTNIADLFATRFDSQGNVQWEKAYPLPGQEFAQDIIQIENEYIILGTSEPQGNQPRHGSAYIAKLNQIGDVIQEGTFGGGEVSACKIFKVNDQKYVLGGTKDISQSFIDSEFWMQAVLDTK